jgi:hypothetical protein
MEFSTHDGSRPRSLPRTLDPEAATPEDAAQVKDCYFG